MISKSFFLACSAIYCLCYLLFLSVTQIKNFDLNVIKIEKKRNLAISVNSAEFPDPQMVLDLSELTVKILQIKSDSNPEDVIPSKYTVHLWIDAEYSTEAMVVTTNGTSYGNRIIVVFRGSESFDDYVANANVVMEDPIFLPDAPDDVKIHKGYQACFLTENTPQRMEDVILNLLNNSTINFDQEIILTGHSLG